MQSLAIAAALIVAYGAVSRRLQSTLVSGPMAFVTAGLLLGDGGLRVLELGVQEEGVRILAEATLVLVLFVDAIQIRLPRLVHEVQLPARLLAIGLPGTVLLGALAALLLFDMQVWEAALLAAVLAPTDAALGQAVVSNPTVPVRIRETLSVESGLNDGLALPLVTLFLGLAAGEERILAPGNVAGFIARLLGVGAVVGVAAGLIGGVVISHAARRGWIDGIFRQLSTFAVAVCAFALSELLGGNGFVAAFVAGLSFGQVARDQCPHAADFADDEGQLLTMLTFLVFGAALAGPALSDGTPQILLYAVLSLTVVRIVPAAGSLLGTGLSTSTLAFVGWFGPRGLASILFVVLIVEEADLAVQHDIVTAVSWTVLLSIFAHGMTADPAARAYGAHAASMREDRAEHRTARGPEQDATG
jgi:NhaP-type Na+/H+ or K+/H+ antiporter